MRKKLSLYVMFSLILVTLGGCNTIEGVGKDIQSAGKGIQDIAD